MPSPDPGVFLRRAIDLRHYENGLALRVRRVLDAARDDIIGKLAALDPNAVGAGFRRRRLEALQRQVEETLATAYRDAARLSRRELLGLAQHTVDLTNGDLRKLVGTDAAATLRTVEVTTAQLRAIVDTSPVQGAVMADWWRDQTRRTATRFERALRIGLVQSETLDQLVVRVRGRAVRRGVYRGGVMSVATDEAEALVRTAVNQVQNTAALRVMEDSPATKKYRWVSTLDARTSPICQALDGTEWRYDDPEAPRPPKHWKCRSRIVPVPDYEALGISRPRYTQARRAAQGGPVAIDTTYDDWLRAQGAATQADILGARKAALYRAGKVGLRDLVHFDGRPLTLEELKARGVE